jgi:Leucine-rich repeat (LRR) protein
MDRLLSLPLLLAMASAAVARNEQGHYQGRQPPGTATALQVGKGAAKSAGALSDSNLEEQRAKQAKAVMLIRNLGGDVVTENEVTGMKADPGAFQRVICVNIRRAKAVDGELALLASFSGLLNLDLSSTHITSAGLEHIKNLKRLRFLNLGQTAIDDLGLVCISELTELRSLCLDGTKITDGGLASLKKLTDLEDVLDLTDTQVSDVGLQQLEHLKKLNLINLRGTLVSEAGKHRLRLALPQARVMP